MEKIHGLHYVSHFPPQVCSKQMCTSTSQEDMIASTMQSKFAHHSVAGTSPKDNQRQRGANYEGPRAETGAAG